MANQFILLLYVFSCISGIICGVYYLIIYSKNKSGLIKSFLALHISYSLLMVLAVIIVYIGVNLLNNLNLQILFTIMTFVCLAVMTFTIPNFSHKFIDYPMTKVRKRIFFTVSLTYIIYIILILIIKSYMIFIPIILGVITQQIVTVYELVITLKFYKTLSKERKIIILLSPVFFIISIAIVFIEMLIKYKMNKIEGFVLNIPIIYLLWNISFIIYEKIGAFSTNENIELTQFDFFKYNLSKREIEISNLLARGFTNKEIAFELQIAFNTVKNHIYNIFQKTNVKTRVELLLLIKK